MVSYRISKELHGFGYAHAVRSNESIRGGAGWLLRGTFSTHKAAKEFLQQIKSA